MKPSHLISLSLTLALASSSAHAQLGRRSGAAAPPAAPAPAWAKFALNPRVRINLDFRNASIDAVLQVLSRASGIAIIKDPSLTGGITLQSPRPQSLNQAFTILNAVLNLKNYEIASEGNFLLVRPRQQAPARASFGASAFGGRGGFGGRRSQTELRTYVLRYADATELARVINDVFAAPPAGQNNGAAFPVIGANPNGANPNAGNAAGNNGGGFGGGGRGRGRRGGFGGFGALGGASAGGDDSTVTVKASADSYSNSLIINAASAQQDQIADIIDQIDKPTDQPQRARVYPLSYALATDLQPVIQNILSGTPTSGRGASTAANNRQGQNRGGGGGFGGFGGFFNRGGGGGAANTANGTVTADTRTNSLIVTATQATIDEVAQVILELDKPATYESSTFVYVMKNARADVVANLLNQSFGNRTTNGPTGGSLTNPTFASGTLATGSTGAPGALTSSTTQRNNNNNNTVTAGQQNQTPATTGIDSQGRIINIRNLTGQVLLVPNIDTNSIIVVAPPEDKEVLESILETMDEIPEQVMIETLVVETNLTKVNQLGVEFNFKGLGGGGSQLFGLGLSTPTPATSTNPQGLRYTLTAGQYQVFLQALQTDTAFNVLSTPRIFTTNNATAQINISQSLPYTTGTTITNGTSQTSVSFLDVGIVLTVTPRITSNGYVTMDVTQTANDFVGYAPNPLNAPIVNQRETQTTVSVKDGETVVLGGLINNSVNKTLNKVPLLGDIPLLGNLFRSTSTTKAKTELLVFMTPHVVRTPLDAERLRAQTIAAMGKTSRSMLPAMSNTAIPGPVISVPLPMVPAPARVAPVTALPSPVTPPPAL